jgi:hypothetical protein
MKTVLTTIIACALYATLRYNVFKGVAWSEWPIYTLNKVFGLSALLLLMIYAIQRRRGQDQAKGSLLSSAWILMLIHSGLSLAILKPAYFVKYFQADKLTWQGGFSMLFGVLAAVGVHKYCRFCEQCSPASLAVKMGGLAFLTGVHAALLGYAGWFQPATWPGHFLPITLISFVAGSVALAAALWPQRKN